MNKWWVLPILVIFNLHADTSIAVEYGDIYTYQADAIVVPVRNEPSVEDTHISRVIAKCAGPRLQEHYKMHPLWRNNMISCAPGASVITPAFDLEEYQITYLIHVAEPEVSTQVSNQDFEKKLYSTYFDALSAGHQIGVKKISFPIIAECEEAAGVAHRAVHDFMVQYPNAYEKIIFTMLSWSEYQAYCKAFQIPCKRSYLQMFYTAATYGAALVATIAIIYLLAHKPLAQPQEIGLKGEACVGPYLSPHEAVEHQCVFAHGLGGDKAHGLFYAANANMGRFVPSDVTVFNFPDAPIARGAAPDLRQCALAQEGDIAALKTAVDKVVGDNVVIFGVSRGASTAVTYQAQCNDPRVKALILESPFDSLESIVAEKMRQFRVWWIPGLHTTAHRITGLFFGKYSATGIRPIDAVKNIQNKELPVLIVCTKKDTLIPWTSSYRLYEEFVAQDFKNVHILILKDGRHCLLLNYGSKNIKMCRDAFAEFFKLYGIRWKSFVNRFGYIQDGRCEIDLHYNDPKNQRQIKVTWNNKLPDQLPQVLPPDLPDDMTVLRRHSFDDGVHYYEVNDNVVDPNVLS